MRLTHITVRSKWQHENDPTWLSEVEVQVAKTVQKLLLLTNITIPVHMNIDQIRRFKTLYSSVGLHCRYSSCKHQCVTYPSETERRKHELAHVRSYKCMECDFAGRPFTSRQDLRKHQEKYHMTAVDFAIPLQIRSLAAKSLPPLRRKTQRLGARQSSVGLSPIDPTSPGDLRTTISNDVHQNTQTTREDAARPKDLDLTDTSGRHDMETFGSADLAPTSFTEFVVAHKLESVGELKAVHSPKMCSISEASFRIGKPMQTATETSYEKPLTNDHIGESPHEPNTCSENSSEDMDIVQVENSTERILRLEDGDSEGATVESCVARCVRVAAGVHLEKHGRSLTAISIDEEARRIRSCTAPDFRLTPIAYWSNCRECWDNCWGNFIGWYVATTFTNGNAIPGISKEETEERLWKLIREIGWHEENTLPAFLSSGTTFLPQEMIRFEHAIKLNGDAAMDLPAFLEKFRMWGPKHLKEHHQRAILKSNAYLGIDEDDIAHWLYNYIGKHMYNTPCVHLLDEGQHVQDWILGGRRDAHPELCADILRLVHPDHKPVHRPVGIDVEEFTHYVLSLLCKKRTPAEIVESLKAYLKPSK